jgi:hypothetical protein
MKPQQRPPILQFIFLSVSELIARHSLHILIFIYLNQTPVENSPNVLFKAEPVKLQVVKKI